MNIGTLLVHLEDAARAKSLVRAIKPLASEHGGHLVGVHVQPPYLLKISEVFLIDLEAVSRAEQERRMAAESIRHLFHEETAHEPFVSEWRHLDAADEPALATTLVAQGRSADFVVASLQYDDDPPLFRQLPARLAIELGRPLVLIPRDFEGTLPARRVVLAWDGSRESARAAFDALPLLVRAERVDIVTVDGDETEAKRLPPGATIAEALARHNVTAEVRAISNSGGGERDGAALLAFAAECGAGLIVMGAYGRRRLSELILGGMTRHVLANSSIPLLLSH